MNLRISKFKKTYKNTTISLEQIDITKRITYLMGPNGSGKSTLLKALMGLIHYEGEITKHISFSYMPEYVNFPIDSTVFEFLQELVYSKKDKKMVENLVQNLDLSQKRNEKIRYLSKGMKAKLNLIQTLLVDADFYLLDEPFNGLDFESIQTLKKIISLSTKQFIISTHALEMTTDLEGEIIRL